MAEEETVTNFPGQCLALGSVRVELFDIYYAAATDIVNRYKLRQIISYVNRTERLELDSKSLDPNSR